MDIGKTKFIRKAIEILEDNRKEGYTIPSEKLYPFQWNWDSSFITFGLVTADEEKSKDEIRKLLSAQWKNGMIPHIIFWEDGDYFPGKKEWEIKIKGIHTSGITQPPIIVHSVHNIFKKTGDVKFLKKHLPRLENLLNWWLAERSEDQALVYVRHPWETGMDNSPAWDEALASINPKDIFYKRRDIIHSSSSEHRPLTWDYDRYIYLLRQAKLMNWDEFKIKKVCPFLIEDILTNSIFINACFKLSEIFEMVGNNSKRYKWLNQAKKSQKKARSKLWNANIQNFVSYNLIQSKQIPINSIAGLISTYGNIPNEEQCNALMKNISDNFSEFKYIVPSYVGNQLALERYWRGPIWINTNWMLFIGLQNYGKFNLADKIKKNSIKLIEKNGFYEYFNPKTGHGIGANNFSWTAALYLDFLEN